MSKFPVPQNMRYCGNCVYWEGERTFNTFFGRAETERDARGRCSNMRGMFNCTCSWQQSCHGFEKHPIVKR
ncbi:MAG: hypothetical protein IKB27_01220 [Clostridia bacterium]|nr:hypothetical protein [Clostridia bacterium]